ncbi:MAG: gliding motility protein GldM [Chitinophagales bacterium]
MINIMYLVLMALLAMNISAEILNAFKVVDKGISNSSTAINGKIEASMQSFEKQIEKNTKGKPAFEAAKKAAPITTNFIAYIDSLYENLIDESGRSEDTSKADADYGYLLKEDDQDTPTRILIGEPGIEGEGYKLERKIAAAREQYISVVRKFAGNNKELQPLVTDLESKMPLKVNPIPADSEKKDWVNHNFYHVPMLPILTMMNQFRNDAISSEAMVVDALFGTIGAKLEIFDKLKPAVIPSSTYLITGEEFTADIFVAATSSQSKPTITVGGQRLTVKDGIATYKTRTSSPGKKTVKGSISVKDGFGQLKKLPFETSYTVATPADHVAIVSPTKMNVFYIGVENPVSCSITGMRVDKISASVSGGGANMSGGSGDYKVTVKQPGEATVTLSGKKRDGSTFTGSSKFRIKRIPDPVAEIAKKNGGTIKTGVFKAQQGMIANLKDFVFDAKFNVGGFEMTVAKRGKDLQTVVNRGGRFSGETKGLISQASVGDIYYFDNIRVKGPDGQTRNLGTIAFKVN